MSYHNNPYPFSIILNDEKAFPHLPEGELLIYGKHDQMVARCDYDGNMDKVHPMNEKGFIEREILLATDRDTIMAWHGPRRKQTTEGIDNSRRFGTVNWHKALKNREAKEERQNRKR